MAAFEPQLRLQTRCPCCPGHLLLLLVLLIFRAAPHWRSLTGLFTAAAALPPIPLALPMSTETLQLQQSKWLVRPLRQLRLTILRTSSNIG